MNIHEYQAKELLAKFGVPVPAGYAAMSVEEAVEAAKKLPGPLWVVKAQIHAGGRGKGKFKELGPDAKGGVRLAKSIEEVRANAEEMLGKTLVTIQTGPQGKQVQRLYITDGVDIAKEFYLALLVDRETGPHRHRRLDRRRHGHREGRPRHAGEDRDDDHRSGDRPDAAPRPRRRRGARPHRRSRQAGRQGAAAALQCLRRHRRLADRDQSARGHRRRQAAGARCQGRLRQQCRVPPPGARGAARPHRRRSDGDRGVEVRPRLHQARRRTSAAWSTAPAWPWRRWTSSS